MNAITLVQSRHSYAPETTKRYTGDRSLPNTLLHVQARLAAIGIPATLIDHNVDPTLEPDTELVGLTVLGMPYIPIVKAMAKKYRTKGQRVIIGGQIVNGLVHRDLEGNILDRTQFDAFFGADAIVGNSDQALASAVGVDAAALPAWRDVTLADSYKQMSDQDLNFYLDGVVPFELSRGCGYNCTFCGALRNQPAEWRESDVIERDLRTLMQRARALGRDTLPLYLTNLDLFQTPKDERDKHLPFDKRRSLYPEALKNFAEIAHRLRSEVDGVRLKMRGLCTETEFCILDEQFPFVLAALRDVGLERIGAGVDGYGLDVWKSIGKRHNNETKSIQFVRRCGTQYGIHPEALMVYGHEKDTEETMARANGFLRYAYYQYEATPRPHLAKDFIPGSLLWDSAVRHGDPRITKLFQEPEYCQSFDFCGLKNSISEPDPVKRSLHNCMFLEACCIGDCLTQPIKCPDPLESAIENLRRRLANIGKFDV